jgi:hypothetical protein
MASMPPSLAKAFCMSTTTADFVKSTSTGSGLACSLNMADFPRGFLHLVTFRLCAE